jgi:hypothetical protein
MDLLVGTITNFEEDEDDVLVGFGAIPATTTAGGSFLRFFFVIRCPKGIVLGIAGTTGTTTVVDGVVVDDEADTPAV